MFYRLLLGSLLTLAGTTAAYAHAHVEASEPEAGKSVAAAPAAVKITFNQMLRPEESYIKVFDAAKKQVNSAEMEASDDKTMLSAPLPEIGHGHYTVKWKAVCFCSDHHATNGSFTFSVK